MSANVTLAKIRPEYVAELVIDEILAGKEEIADPASLEQKAMLTENPEAFWRYMQEGWDAYVPGTWDRLIRRTNRLPAELFARMLQLPAHGKARRSTGTSS